MAKTQTPSAPAGLVKAEIVDTRTGEVVDANSSLAHSEADNQDAAILALLSGPDMKAALAAAEKAPVAAFKVLEVDFWRHGAPGTPEAVLQGIFLGSGKKGERLLQHVFGKLGSDGKPYTVTVNGTHGLTGALKQCEPRDTVRIEYLGDAKSAGLITGVGQTFKKWDVKRIPYAGAK